MLKNIGALLALLFVAAVFAVAIADFSTESDTVAAIVWGDK
jgi:hypothetical protein